VTVFYVVILPSSTVKSHLWHHPRLSADISPTCVCIIGLTTTTLSLCLCQTWNPAASAKRCGACYTL